MRPAGRISSCPPCEGCRREAEAEVNQEELSLSTVLRALAAERWEARRQPLSLSDVGTALKGQRIDYRAILKSETLKGFIQRTQAISGYRLVEVPKTKFIAIAPDT